MKFSIITPIHKNQPFIKELYESIRNQTHKNWEWIIWINGSASKDHLSFIESDNRIKIYIDNSKNINVGYHKNMAFNLGSGDVLVEADHDDILTSDALAELYTVYNKHPDVGFVFSDNAKLSDNFIPYNSNYGWENTNLLYNSKELWCPKTFQASSHSVSLIWYAPDHIRSWRKNIYKKVGGHDQNLSILDDQDLIIRTYLETKFMKIDKVLYIYRIHGENTWLERNKDIQIDTIKIRNKYIKKLAERDAKLNNLKMLDINKNNNKLDGYIKIHDKYGDINCDLNDGIPMPDDSCYIVNAEHIIEHLKDPIKTMKEIHRVLAHGGWAFIEVPSTDGRGAFQNPEHVSFWNENSFWYYTNKRQAQTINNSTIRFQKSRLETLYPDKWYKDNKISIVYADLIAIKDSDQRFPGSLDI